MNDTSHKSDAQATLPWGLRVRELRVGIGMTQEELAAKVGTTKATISKIERSTGRPRFEWIEKLAPALGVDLATLALDAATPLRQSTMIPVIGLIAAGNWREAIQSPDGFIPAVGATEHMFALKVHGDSIDKIAPDGAFISIDPTSPHLQDGDLYAVQNGDGEATVKRFRRSPDRLEPESSNPVHRPIMLGKEPITIIGRATSVVQML
jgi:repressor LexA